VRDADEKRQLTRARDRERRGGRGYDGVTDEQIYRRDKWVCLMPECVCPDGRAIDPELAGTGDPWAPSIDHVVPLRDGGLDNARNKRAAHARCNNSANEQDQAEEQAVRSGSWQPQLVPLTAAAGELLGNSALAALEELRQALGKGL
jgi:5-methylcytosine-specific restriction endonuclease McrA